MVAFMMFAAVLAAFAWCGFSAAHDAKADRERREVFEEMVRSNGDDADALLREYLAIR